MMEQVSTVATQAWLRLIMDEAGIDTLTIERIDDNGLIVRAGRHGMPLTMPVMVDNRKIPKGDFKKG
jgi:hypothetical protein